MPSEQGSALRSANEPEILDADPVVRGSLKSEQGVALRPANEPEILDADPVVRGSLKSRRKALAAISGSAVLLPVLGQAQSAAPRKPNLSPSELTLLAELTGHIIPKTDTPGAVEAGVPGLIDAGLAANPQRLQRWKAALAWFAAQGKTPEARLQVLERISKERGTEGATHFTLLKNETIDLYYSTQEGLKTELGWNANTFLDKFEGCTHPEHKG